VTEDAIANAPPLLSIRSLRKQFGGVRALSDVSIDAAAGHVVSIFGPNGAGKTTLFNMICRLYPPTSGSILLNGEDLGQCQPHDLPRRGTGRTFQNLALFRHGTVVDNLLVGMHAHLRSGVLSAVAKRPPDR
jgi:branched-chain amino acid transport system ATP-binding protein